MGSLLPVKRQSPCPEIIADRVTLPKGPVLVVVPHPDDDVLSVGGIIRRHRLQNDSVQVIVCFNGALGNSAKPELSREELIKLREAETCAAGQHLGLKSDDYHFFRWDEGHVPPIKLFVEAAHNLAEHILGLDAMPTTVYAPWIGEYHLDHHVISRLVSIALRLIGFQGEAWGWEVWTPLIPHRIVDVTSVYKEKLAALEEHRSQLAHTDLARIIDGLNAHHGLYLTMNQPDYKGYGEALTPLGEVDETDWALMNNPEY